MQRQVQVLEEKYKDIAQLKSMKEQVEELKKERVWAEVIDTEKVTHIHFIIGHLCNMTLFRERVQISGGNPMIGIGTDQFPDCSESVCFGWALSAIPIPMRSVPI